jgi:ribonuclease VapC
MIVLDSSAIIAVLLLEPEAVVFAGIVGTAPLLVMSAMQLHETGVVLHRRGGMPAVQRFMRFVREHNIRVIPFDEQAALDATAAYQRYGKGTGHPAQLNLADCAAYALATRLGVPLLFKGEDFARTDVARALPAS